MMLRDPAWDQSPPFPESDPGEHWDAWMAARPKPVPTISPIDARYRDRLAFEPDISDESPVVQGTWVTVDHVVSLLVDGFTWSDILRSHPELTEGDIRACIAYAVEHDEIGGGE